MPLDMRAGTAEVVFRDVHSGIQSAAGYTARERPLYQLRQ